jgi:hypothetical protein
MLPLLGRSRRADYLCAVTGQILRYLLQYGCVGLYRGRWQPQSLGRLAETSIPEMSLQSARRNDGEHTDYAGLEGVGVSYAVWKENESAGAGLVVSSPT